MKRLAIVGAVVAVVMLSGCSSSSKTPASGATNAWTAPTTYRFTSLDARQAPKIESILQSRKLLYRRTDDSPLTYEVKGLRDTGDLTRLNRELSEATGQPFETAAMQFGGMDPSATAYSNVELKVTPGASAFVADGPANAPWRRVYVDSKGTWRGLVNTKQTVANKGGWLYVAATNAGLTKYSRVHVASRKAEALSFTTFKDSDLPAPGTLPKSSTAEGKDSGFKWPWD
ncbi:MAG: hypothetical protein J0L61_13270 [Planctomycetes bacterium]|nr:hypothetical protein [Planctomycetota bacterium]